MENRKPQPVYPGYPCRYDFVNLNSVTGSGLIISKGFTSNLHSGLGSNTVTNVSLQIVPEIDNELTELNARQGKVFVKIGNRKRKDTPS
jgi:hypothetical protein